MQKLALLILFVLISGVNSTVFSQARQTPVSQQFREAVRLIRIAEPGQLADSVNVWGDVSSTGMYLVPKNTSLVELMTYGFGPNTINDAQTRVDWSKLRVEVYVNEYNDSTQAFNVSEFSYRFEEPIPAKMQNFQLKNKQTVVVRVKRKPTIRDYIGVIAPAISAVATSILLFERLSRL